MGSTGDDPRTDKSGSAHPPKAGESKSYPAPGGAGTGTKGDPAASAPKK